MRRATVVVGCSIVSFFAVVTSAFAVCTCGQTWPAGAYEAAQVVFEGTVRSTNGYTDASGRRWQEAILSVSRAWKAAGSDTVLVRTPVGKDQCGLDFWIGEAYLVYARSTENGVLSTTRCDRTEMLQYADEDLLYLEQRWDRSPDAGEVFPDVPTDHPAYQAVMDLYGAGIMTGYRDGLFRPERRVSRAEIVKVLIDAAPGYRTQNAVTRGDPYDAGWLRFRDVETGDWFVPFLRTAVDRKLVQGYRDGTFRPEQSVSTAEASKMIAVAFGLSRTWDGPLWYEQYLEALEERGALPPSLQSAETPLQRGELAQIVWRVREGRTDLPSMPAHPLLHQDACQLQDDPGIAGVDMRRVRSAWLDWYNHERARLGLRSLELNAQLNHTAYLQATTLPDLQPIRPELLRRSLAENGLQYAGSDAAAQSAWSGEYVCHQSECTDELLASLRRAFDVFQAQREQGYGPDWSAMTAADYRLLGLGVSVADGQYTLVTQVSRTPQSSPRSLCRQVE